VDIQWRNKTLLDLPKQRGSCSDSKGAGSNPARQSAD